MAAIRALLRQPLLTPASQESLAIVRRHLTWLREFFAEHFGWMLHVERELVRLAKTPGDASTGNRAARPADGVPFSKRRYVVFCLALAAIERMDRQTTLQKIAEGVVGLAANDPSLASTGFAFGLAMPNIAKARSWIFLVRSSSMSGNLPGWRRSHVSNRSFRSSSL
jgi:uncharacterized protein (TIGR02678 family)